MSSVTYRKDGDVGVITMDDGKMNSFSFAHMDALSACLDEAAGDDAVVLAGNDRCFSAGFDLGVMMAGDAAETTRMIEQGCEIFLRLFEFRRPVLAASTGHALAAGAIALLACDVRVGAPNPKHKVGLNEVRIGLSLPIAGVELARHRLAPTHLSRVLCQAEVFAPQQAVAVGFLDRVAASEEAVLAETLEQAHELAEALKSPAFEECKMKERGAVAAHIRDTLAADMEHYRRVLQSASIGR